MTESLRTQLVSLLTAAGVCLMTGGIDGRLGAYMLSMPQSERMKNVTVLTASPVYARPVPGLLVRTFGLAPPQESFSPPPMPTTEPDTILETTIEGGMRIKNETGYWVDAAELLAEGPGLTLPPDEPQILIIHTHASEAYTPAGLDRYEASDVCRTEDARYSIIRVGDELCGIYEAAGLRVVHDQNIYDYPSYTGSYARSGAAVEEWLAEYPGIAVVIDMHRDALGSDGVVYKIMAEESGSVASQVMLLCGSDKSGLEHPNWRSNLALALYLQDAATQRYPSLMRPVELVPQRYNQHLSPGALILEVGSSGNTLQEALAAIRLFGEATAPALLALGEA